MTRRAILIASSRFPEEAGLPDLECPENDVDGMRAVLEAPEVGGFDEVQVLKNEESWKVRKILNKTLRTAKKSDLVLVYYSGHGKLSRTGHLCLTMTDTEFDVLDATSIHTDEIKRYVSTSDCRMVALLLDCCYSGAAGKSFLRSAADDQLQLMSQDQAGLFIMTASTGVQTAQERESSGYGLFTQFVIEGLKEGAADLNGDGHVTVDELFDFVEQRVMDNGSQAPKKWGLGVQGSLVMARGRKTWTDELRRDAKRRLLQLSQDDVLPDAILTSGLELLGKERGALDAREQRFADLLRPLVAGELAPARFISAWYELREQAVEPAPAARTSRAKAAKGEETTAAPAAPKLKVKPARTVDFGTVEEGARHERELEVSNAGEGELEWTFRAEGGFLQVRRTRKGLKLIVKDLDVGEWEGAVAIDSNGGSKRVAVKVAVEAEASPEDAGYEDDYDDGPGVPAPAPGIGPGRWQVEMVALGFVKSHFVLDLMPGGQASGSQTLMGMSAPVFGGWGFDPHAGLLTLQLTAQMGGMQGSDVLQVQITGEAGGTFSGVDGMGRKFTLRRMG